MPQTVSLEYGDTRLTLSLPDGVEVCGPLPTPARSLRDPLAVVAEALDQPVDAPALTEAARGKGHVAIVVPDEGGLPLASTYLLPVLARLARAGLAPQRIRVVMARGLHAAAPRAEVERLVGAEVMAALRPIQSAPELPDWNMDIGLDEELGPVRVHRTVAEAGLVLLTGPVRPHHLAGFTGGADGLVPGVAARETVLAAHRLTLRSAVAPDGALILAPANTEGPFRSAVLRVARAFGRCLTLGLILDDAGSIAAAVAGEVGAAHAVAARRHVEVNGAQVATPCDLVLVGAAPPRSQDLTQAHKSLMAALAWARPGAAIVWLARAPEGPGPTEFLRWFEAGRLDRHLAALRQQFHPLGLTAYAVRRCAADHAIHVVSEVSPDITRGMGLLPHPTPQAALAAALAGTSPRRVAVLPHG